MAERGRDQEPTKGFEDLKAWQLARKLMLECHELANSLPATERYDLVQQIRRASKSVMANIAEGYGRYHFLDSLRFYYIARGSVTETVNHLIVAHDLNYVTNERFTQLYQLGRECEMVLNGYIAYVWRQRQGADHYGRHQISDSQDIIYTISEEPSHES